MVELIGGSGVYLYKSQLAMCKSSCKSRSSLACQLLRVFFTEDQLIHGKLSDRADGEEILDPQIVNVIKGKMVNIHAMYCIISTLNILVNKNFNAPLHHP